MKIGFMFDYRSDYFSEYTCGECEVHLWYLYSEGGRDYYAARLVKDGKILVQLERWSPAPRMKYAELGGETVGILTSQAELASRVFQRHLYFEPTPWTLEQLEFSADDEWSNPRYWNDWEYDEAIRRLLEFPDRDRYFLADLDDWLFGVLALKEGSEYESENHYDVQEVA